jgi:hypothetical protein
MDIAVITTNTKAEPKLLQSTYVGSNEQPTLLGYILLVVILLLASPIILIVVLLAGCFAVFST